MLDIPINFIRDEGLKDNCEKKHNRDLWIGVAGKVRDKVTTIDIFRN